MNIANLSDESLLSNLSLLVQKERALTLDVLRHLREVERRSLYAKLSYSSLFEYVVKELKYSEGAAQRRISSMRLLRELPQIETKVESGTLTLSALSHAQIFFRQEKDHIKTAVEKIEVLRALENKSIIEVQRELTERSSAPLELVRETVRPLAQGHSELKMVIDESLLRELEELRALLSHAKPGASIKDLISYAVGVTVERLRVKAPAQASVRRQSAVQVASRPAKTNSRFIPAHVKREVWFRDGGECGFTNAANGRKCSSKHGLQYDHILPFAMGGKSTAENLRLRCRAHNQLTAIAVYGEKKIAKFVPRMS